MSSCRACYYNKETMREYDFYLIFYYVFSALGPIWVLDGRAAACLFLYKVQRGMLNHVLWQSYRTHELYQFI